MLPLVMRSNALVQARDFTALRKKHELNLTLFCFLKRQRSQIKGFLHDDLCSRGPGRSLSIDATFKIAQRVSGEAGCLTFVFGEYGHILGHAAHVTESFNTLVPLLHQ